MSFYDEKNDLQGKGTIENTETKREESSDLTLSTIYPPGGVQEEQEEEGFSILFNESNQQKLNKFISEITVCVLSNCIDQLGIMRSVNIENELENYEEGRINYKTIEERYMGQEDYGECRIYSFKGIFDKLAKHVHRYITILRDTSEELINSGTYTTLTESVVNSRRMTKDEERLMEDVAYNAKLVEELKMTYEHERLKNIATIAEMDEKIQTIKFDSEDIYLYGKKEKMYFQRWENARKEQNRMTCDEKEKLYTSVIDEMKNKIDIENRCHSEISRYLNTCKEDHLDAIQYWMKTYDDELDRREGELIKLNMRLEEAMEDREKAEEKLKQRITAMEDWIEYKRLKKERIEDGKRRNMAAIRIQRWWRRQVIILRKKRAKQRKKAKKKK